MGEAGGWERPDWFAAPGQSAEYVYSYGRQNWFAQCAEECRTVATQVALFDQSSMAKLLVQGRDACAVLNRLSSADIDVADGRIVYSQWLNPRGGIEADLTVTRLTRSEFLVVTSVASHRRDLATLCEQISGHEHCVVTDITSGLPMLGLMGPGSRDLLAALSGEDLADAAFPFGTSREMEIGCAIVRANRITYVGELGWELYIPAEFAVHVFDRIVALGADHGLGFAGMRAMNACRVEKGYRHWGHDIGIEDTPFEAGLASTCAWDKPGGFIGRDALLARRSASPPRRRLVQLRLADAHALLYHEEPIWVNGRICGSVTSGAYGHRLNASLGMGYIQAPGIDAQWLAEQCIEVEVAGERVPAQAQLAPLYDPRNTRIRC